MALTYEPIATTTLGSQTTSITFSSIPQTYTDLVLVCVGTIVTAGNSVVVEINGDTTQLGSWTYMYGNGTTAASGRTNNRSYVNSGWNVGYDSTQSSTSIVHFFNYTSASTFQTSIARMANPSGSSLPGTEISVNLWRSKTAITSLKVFTGGGGDLKSGFRATLYGIKAA